MLLCRVELYDDDDPAALPLQAIYGDATQSPLTTGRLTRTSYHNANPRFDDEFKIMLPLKLHRKHHIRITYFHVAVTPKAGAGKKDTEPVESIVGYSIIPLLAVERSQQIVGPDVTGAVYLQLQPSYLQALQHPTQLHPLDSLKPLLRCHARVVSSVQTQEPVLGAMFDALQSRDEGQLTSSLNNLKTVDVTVLRWFLPGILDLLCEVIADTSLNAACGMAAYGALVLITTRYCCRGILILLLCC